MSFIDTAERPANAVKLVADYKPTLLQSENHKLCPGCGHPVAMRAILEVIAELELTSRSVCVYGHGCYAIYAKGVDIEGSLTLHGRAPAYATGLKRMRPDCSVWTLQGDGDMVSEGLAEILHTAARGENITCFMLNNGVFGDTGGQMTATTVLGQRTKNTLQGREPGAHGFPIPIADMLAKFPGVAYVARGSVYNLAGVAKTRKYIKKAFQHQEARNGLSIVEILTMCPTGWFVPAKDGPDYLHESMEPAYPIGELKDVGFA